MQNWSSNSLLWLCAGSVLSGEKTQAQNLAIVDLNFKQISKESLVIESSDLLYAFTLVYN